MEKQPSMFIWLLFAALLSHNLILVPVMATSTGLSASLCNSHGHHGHHGSSPPSHSTPSPPSGGCETPPVEPPPTPCTPTPSTPTPSTPTPTTPSNPPSGGGYYPPSTPTPTTPSTPTPSTPTPSTPTPSTPTPSTPTPYTPTPTTPTTPTPPYTPDPNSPYSCNYWRTHPGLIWGLFGWWGTVGSAFGVTAVPGFGTSMSLQQALSNTRTDGYGSLYREGTASLLNSMVSHKFPYTAREVRETFVSALGSNKAAGAQGELFKQANEGKFKIRA